MADVNNPIHYSDLFVPDDSLNNLIKQLNEIADAYQFAANLINNQALKVSASLQNVSGATESGRQAIAKASAETDKLAKAQAQLAAEESEVAKQIAIVKQATHEQATLNKLAAKEINSMEGSYNRLSAQYSRMKIIINGWSEAQRKANADYIAEARGVYEKMKQMQAETGKMQLNVGNYADAAMGLRGQLRDLVQQMAALQMAGKGNTAEYAALAQKAGALKDAMSDASQAVTRMASDTGALDTVMQGLTSASGGFTALTGALTLFGGESEDVAEAQKKLQSVMAITMGLTKLQNAFQKQSALMLGITKVQTMALAKAEAYERLIKIKGTAATKGATAAQAAFNVVAKANPYVLLAMALVTVVGALWAFSKGSKDAAEKQKELNDAANRYIDIHIRLVAIIKQQHTEAEKATENEIALAKARGDSIENIRKLEDKLAEQKRAHLEEEKQENEEYLRTEKENQAAIEQTLKLIQELNKKPKDSKITLRIDGVKSKYSVEEGIQALQDWIDRKQKGVDIAVNLRTREQDLAAEEEQRAAERAKEDAERAKEVRKNEIAAVRDFEQAKINNIKNAYEKERATIIANGKKAIEDLQERLRTEDKLNSRAREAIRQRILQEQIKTQNELNELAKKQAREEAETVRETEDMVIAAMTDGEQKELAQLQANYQRRRNELANELADEGKYTEEQRISIREQLLLVDQQYQRQRTEVEKKWEIARMQQAQEATQLRLEGVREGSQEEMQLRLQLINQNEKIEIEKNRQLVESQQKDETLIRQKYQRQRVTEISKYNKEQIDLWYQQSEKEIGLMNITENKKERLMLRLEKQRLEKVIKLMEDGQIEGTEAEINTYKAQLAKLAPELNIFDKALTHQSTKDNWKESLQESADYTLEILSTVTEARVKMAEKAVQAADKEVESAKSVLEAEREAAANGYANNQEMAAKQLELAKENQRKALEQQKKAQKRQQAIDTLTQISSLVTASANMWKDLGFPAALVGIATMWASFAASKIMGAKLAKQNTEQYGEGTVELLQGGSHASGNDIDLGTKPDGTRRRAEGGEYFAVINKRSSRRYRRTIPDVINSLNKGTFNEKYLNAYDMANSNGVGMIAGGTDVSVIESEVRKIREQGETKTYIDAQGNMIVKRGNLTQKIRQ